MNIKDIFTAIGKIKDVVYIISFIIMIGGFLVKLGESKERQLEMANNLTKIENLLQDQLVLNGKIIMYMQMDQHQNTYSLKFNNKSIVDSNNDLISKTDSIDKNVTILDQQKIINNILNKIK